MGFDATIDALTQSGKSIFSMLMPTTPMQGFTLGEGDEKRTYRFTSIDELTGRQFEEALDLVGKISPVLAPLVDGGAEDGAPGEGSTGGGKPSVSGGSVMKAISEMSVVLKSGRLIPRFVATIYKIEGVAFDDGYPLEECVAQCSGCPALAFGGALTLFFPISEPPSTPSDSSTSLEAAETAPPEPT